MKKFSVYLPVAVVVLASAAVTQASQQMEFGLLGGVSLSNAASTTTLGGVSTSAKLDPISSFTWGGAAYFGFQPDMGVELDLMYQPRGYNDSVYTSASTGASTTVSGNSAVNYLTVPVMFRYTVMEHMRFGVGAYAAFAMSDVTTTTGSSTSTTVTTTRSNAGLSGTDMGLVASARWAIPLFSNVDAVADFRYMHGLSNIYSPSVPQTNGTTAEIKLRDILFLMGATYKF